MGTFELIGAETELTLPEPHLGLAGPVLVQNVRWFMMVRWVVIGVFLVAGLTAKLIPETITALGLVIPVTGLWILSAALVLANTMFFVFVRRIDERTTQRAVKLNLWLQIIVDLIAVTVLVYLVGSTETFAAFTYLFHITLACIFFPKRLSLLVTLLAAGFYLVLVVLEILGVWPDTGILMRRASDIPLSHLLEMLFACSAVFIWFLVWYLVSSLSATVQKRDQQLSIVNEQLVRADQEKTRQMLLTTHDLKAPFAGIESNIQVLKIQLWDEIPAEARTIIDRIDRRAETLRERINAILLFGDLKSHAVQKIAFVPVDLRSVIDIVLDDLNAKAEGRKISVEVNVPAVKVPGDKKQFCILFSNLLANAIAYSPEGGKVKVTADQHPDEIRLFVSDRGIGIREEALAHIFDEYYRTNEGAKYNRQSTGLGLAIVKEIVKKLKLSMRVSSEIGSGTTFEVGIPRKRKQ